MRLFRNWRPKGKMYSLKCNQCGEGFLSSHQLEAPICGKCLQKAKSLDSTIEHEKQCLTCGAQGVIYGKKYCYSCYFGFGKKQRMNA
jgi:ribosomal protein S27AE